MGVNRPGPSTSIDWTPFIPPDSRVVLRYNPPQDFPWSALRRRSPAVFLASVCDGSNSGVIPCRDASADDGDRFFLDTTSECPMDRSWMAPGSVDCLAIGPPLEECTSIGRLLDLATRVLSRSGILLAWSSGEIDRSDSWSSVFQSVGLQPIEVEPWLPESIPFDGDIAPRDSATLAGSCGIIFRAVWSSDHVRRMTIKTLTATPICSRVRTEEPSAMLRTIPGVRTRTDYASSRLLDWETGGDRILIRQRNILGPKDVPALKALRRAGYLIVCEWDDDPAIFPEIAMNDHLTFRGCHCVQTSTQPLAEVLRSFNPHVQVFRNEIAELPPPRGPRSDGPVTILFGALNREEDWRPLIPGLHRVLSDLSDRVKVQVLHDRAFFEALPNVDSSFRPFAPFDEYLEVLSRCDIALLPLAPSRFNQCKSDLKFIECAAGGIACLASEIVYEHTIRDGVTGLIYRSAAEFEVLLRRLILESPLRSRLQEAAYRYVVRHRMLGLTFRQRYRWYREMCHRLPDLDRELCDRAPELR